MVTMIDSSVGGITLKIIISTPVANGERMNSSAIVMSTNQHIDEGPSGMVLENVCEEEETLVVGTHFFDSTSLKNALRSYAITNNCGIKLKTSDKKRVIAICSYRGCPWRVRASVCADGQTFELRKMEGLHSCPGVNRAGNKQATTSWIASEIQDLVKKQSNVAPKQIKDNLENTYGLSLPYMKLWRARELARESLFGFDDDNYRWVPTLRSELVKRNPGSHIRYTYDDTDNTFQRFYVSFKVSIDGFLAGCRRLIGIDACLLKSKFLGIMLSANALDGNNGLFTLEFAVVETESKKTWEWFLQNLLQSIGFQLYPLAFVSDMEKGLAEALVNIFPEAEHRVCLRHLWKNLKKFFHCPEDHKIQSLVWSAANAILHDDLKNKMDEINIISPKIYSYLVSLRFKWSRCQFLDDIKSNSNTNNMSESFNAWVAEVRDKPIVDLVDLLRGKMMEQREKRWVDSGNWRSEIVPCVEEYIHALTRRKDQLIVRHSTTTRAEVEGKSDRHLVDIDSHECTCRLWQMTGLPCIHAAALIGMREEPSWLVYINEFYHVTRYQMAYAAPIAMLPSKEQWDVADETQILPPKTVRPRGRPRKNRFKGFMESDKKTHRCGRCGNWGHHKKNCKNPLT